MRTEVLDLERARWTTPFGTVNPKCFRRTSLATFDIKLELSPKDNEALIFCIVFVPVIFPTEDADTHHGIVHLSQGLTEPSLMTRDLCWTSIIFR
jgi:hypothetical protein